MDIPQPMTDPAIQPPMPRGLRRRIFGWLTLGMILHGLVAIFILVNLLLVTAECINSVGRPWGGFNFNYYFKVSDPQPELSEAGKQVGLGLDSYGVRAGDVLIRVNGQAPRFFDDAISRNPIITRDQSGTPNQVTYVLGRTVRGVERQITVTAKVYIFSFSDFFALYGISLIIGWLMYLVGILVYMLKPHDRPSQLFMLTMVVASGVVVTGFEGVFTYRVHPLDFAWFGMFSAVLLATLGASSFQLATQFPGVKPFVVRQPLWQYALHPISIGLGILYAYQTQAKITDAVEREEYITTIPAESLTFFFTGLCMLALMLSLIWDATRSPEPLVRRQSLIILLGVMFGLGPTIFLTVLPKAISGQEVVSFPITYSFLVAIPLTLGYAIIRYRLFTLNFVLRRSIAYLTASVLVVALYFASIALLQVLLVGENASQFVVVISTLVTAILFNPIRERMQGLLERYFFRERFVFEQAMLDFGANLGAIYDLDALSYNLVSGLTRIMNLQDAVLYLATTAPDGTSVLHRANSATRLARGAGRRGIGGFRDEDSGEEETAQQWPTTLPVAANLRQWMMVYRTPLNVGSVPPHLPSSGRGLVAALQEARATMFVPLAVQERLVGLLALKRRGGMGIGREEVDLLTALLPQAVLSLRNAQLLVEAAEQERVATELELARSIQRGLFPTSIPQPPGLQIAAFCLPARETSGDFYDVVDFPDQLALMIADACGKSVPAAMTMGLARNTVRSEIGHQRDPGAALTRANRWLVEDMGGTRYVALTYLLIERVGRRLTLANAGGLSPILCRAGQCSFVSTPGLTVPLGVTYEVKYEQSSLELQLGDRLLLYTDGIVEATNLEGEMFSFERLEATIASYLDDSSEGLIRHVLAAVEHFCGEAVQADDMTLVAILPA